MSRVIRKSQAASATEAADLLASLFSAELCLPSRCLWLVSPWVSNVELIDNTAGTFSALNRFGKRQVRLAEILVALATADCHVVVGTTADPHNRRFLEQLRLLASDLRVVNRVTTSIDASNLLHSKALTGDDFALDGSMNITYNGIGLREETVSLHVDKEHIAEARMSAFERFGGVL